MSGSLIAPLSICSHQNVNIGTPYHSPPFTSTRSNILNFYPVSFFLQVHDSHSLMRRLCPEEVLGVLVVQGTEKKGPTATRTIGVACTLLLCSRSCHSHSFLIIAFASPHGVHKVSVNMSSSSPSLTLDGSVSPASSG